MSKKIVLVDDEEDILELLQVTFKKESYAVEAISDSTKAVDTIKNFEPDIVFLDIMMPEKDGYEICREIRNNKSLKQPYIIFLSARTDEIDEILGLELGADDYIRKVFSIRQVLAKTKSVFNHLERKENVNKSEENIVRIGQIEVNRNSYTVLIDSKEVKFLHKEFELLLFLMRRPGIVFSRAQLLDEVWGENVFFVERTIDVHITKIRKKLAPYSNLIKTVSGVGYKFVKE